MTIVQYYIKPELWKPEKPQNHRSTHKPIQPGYVPSTLEDICYRLIDDALPPAWDWTQDKVCDWLGTLGLDIYKIVFQKNKITGSILPTLDICMLQKMGIEVFGDAIAILHGICELFDIKPNKKFNGPIEEPLIDPRRMYFWYRRKFELTYSQNADKHPANISDWLYEKGFMHRHYKRWYSLKYFNKLPFKIGFTCPLPQENLL